LSDFSKYLRAPGFFDKTISFFRQQISFFPHHQPETMELHQKVGKLLQSDPLQVLAPIGLGVFLAIALQLFLRRLENNKQLKTKTK
jgi:hypothetical protein